MSRIRIIGVGSPWGDDQIGWLAADAIKTLYDTRDVEVLTVDRPGPMLIEYLGGVDKVILLDAVHGSGPSGRIYRLGGAELMCLARPQMLSHNMGVAEAVALAASLAKLPKDLCLIGVELEHATPGCDLSDAVQAALPAFIAAAQNKIQEWLQDSAGCRLNAAH